MIHLTGAHRRLAAAIGAAAAFAVSQAAATPVETQSGLVEGVEAAGVTVYKGLPFAAPPVGALRWRAPEAPAAWEGVRRADAFAPICPQSEMYPKDSPPEPTSEDCLYLNIWAPAGAREAGKLPVMVWIYGGGLTSGSSSTPLYAGDALARRGVIVVTFNYRLGALGFLAHPDLTRESPAKVSGNYGHLDQVAALNWVKRNIAAFGGDADNVTLFGQSSGSISVSTLVASPLARGLFKRAIGESGGLFEPLEVAPEFMLAGAEKEGAAFAERLGAQSLDALRALPASEISARPYYPHANVDGYFLTGTPYKVLSEGRGSDVDLLIGSNAEEGLDFVGDRRIGADNMSDELKRDFPAFIVALVGPKAPADDKAARDAFIAFESDMRFGWNMWSWARLSAAAGKHTYFYRFTHTPPDEEGATHGAEMRYVFDHLDLQTRAWTANDHRLADTMADYWTNFARTGDPNGEGLPDWPAFDSSERRALHLGTDYRAARVDNERSIQSIDRLYAAVRFLLQYGAYVAGALALLVLVALWRIVRFVLRAWTPRKA